MSNKGLIVRTFPKAQFLRGWNPQTPHTRTHSFPIESNPFGVYCGMLMSLNTDGTKWVKGVPASDANTGIIAFAQNDGWQDDVQDAGQLVGLDSSGQFRIATPFFKRYKDAEGTLDPEGKAGEFQSVTPHSYTAGTPLTWCSNTEVDAVQVVEVDKDTGVQVAKTLLVSCAGYVKPAGKGDTVIGVVSQTGAGRYLTKEMQRRNSNPFIGPVVKGLNRDAAGYNEGLLRNGTVTVADGAVTQGESSLIKMGEGVYPLMTSIGSAVTSDSEIYTAYYIVFDTTNAGVKVPTA
jgi:hypothetical protein